MNNEKKNEINPFSQRDCEESVYEHRRRGSLQIGFIFFYFLSDEIKKTLEKKEKENKKKKEGGGRN